MSVSGGILACTFNGESLAALFIGVQWDCLWGTVAPIIRALLGGTVAGTVYVASLGVIMGA